MSKMLPINKHIFFQLLQASDVLHIDEDKLPKYVSYLGTYKIFTRNYYLLYCNFFLLKYIKNLFVINFHAAFNQDVDRKRY